MPYSIWTPVNNAYILNQVSYICSYFRNHAYLRSNQSSPLPFFPFLGWGLSPNWYSFSTLVPVFSDLNSRAMNETMLYYFFVLFPVHLTLYLLISPFLHYSCLPPFRCDYLIPRWWKHSPKLSLCYCSPNPLSILLPN